MPRRPAARVRTLHTTWSALALVTCTATLTVAAPRSAAAQVVTVDEGSFAVSRGGAPLGREEFRIMRQSGAAATFMARATGNYGDRRVTPALQADGNGTPERYQVEVRRGGVVEQRVSAQGAGAHFQAQSQGESGEAAREFLLDPGTVVLDDEVYHQYYFLVRRAAAGAATRVPVLDPRRGSQSALVVTLDGTERITVGGQAVAARHYVLTDRASGGRREVWTDEQGRVLRVVLAGAGIEAVRSDVPR